MGEHRSRIAAPRSTTQSNVHMEKKGRFWCKDAIAADIPEFDLIHGILLILKIRVLEPLGREVRATHSAGLGQIGQGRLPDLSI